MPDGEASERRRRAEAMHLTAIQSRAPGAAPRNKIVSAAEAVRLIHDGDTVATGGFVGIGFAEGIAVALEQRFLATEAETGTGAPRDLTLVYAAGQGDGKERGLNHFGHAGLVKRVDRRPLGPGAAAAGARGRRRDRGLQPAAGRDHAPVPRHRRRQAGHAAAAIGLGTFVDPRHGGGKINAAHHRRPGRADGDRRRGVPVLQGVPDPRRHHPRAPPPTPTAT